MRAPLKGLPLLFCAFISAAAPNAYIDSALCGTCHAKIAAAYAKTGMGQSFHSVGKDARLPEFGTQQILHEASGDRFTMLRRGEKYFVRRSQAGPAGEEVNVFEEPVDYAIGSGNHAISYLHRTLDNKLLELPVSWYAERGGHWGMSPGYDRSDHPGFSREISDRCMFCHNGYPETSPASGFPAKLPQGIDCQRCHGPGAEHVEALHQRRSAAEVRAAIVNPARLTPERGMEVCMQCHLETAGMQMPVAAVGRPRGVFSYIPGEPLSDYLLYFDPAPGAGHDDRFELVSSAYRLRKSQCFRASAGRLTCITCHDPHTALTRNEALARANDVCLGCHGAAVAGRVKDGRHTAAADCTSCHMPSRQGVDAIHITVTDHLIQRPGTSPPPAPLIEEHDGNTLPYAGQVAAYYPETVDPLNMAIAQVKEFANVPDGLANLEKLLSGSPPRSGAPWFELAEAFFGTGQIARSLVFYRKALNLEPENWRYLHGLGEALENSGRPDQAIPNFEKSFSLAPGETTLLDDLGAAYARLGRIADAIRAFREALIRNPVGAATQNNLGLALGLSGDAAGAEAAFREAVRLRPEMGALRMNYASALIRNGRLADAQFQLEQAIRTGPSSGRAREAWFAQLAATGSVAEAHKAYGSSMQTQLSAAHNNLGTLFLSRGDTEGAIREYRSAVDCDPQSSLAQLNLGQTLLEHGKPSEGGEHLMRAAESSDPKIRAAAGELLRRIRTGR